MVNAATAVLTATKQPYLEKYTLSCNVQCECENMTNAGVSLDAKYIEDNEEKRMDLEPPCYHNRPIMGHIVASGKDLPPCLASVKARCRSLCWKQFESRGTIAKYQASVDLEK